VRSCVVSVCVLWGCYAPGVPADVPCSPDGTCPGGQSCIANVCVVQAATSPDAPSGGKGDGFGDDRDSDGVPNASDNCPDLANSDQANEDGDRFGDACDPCPELRDDTGLDTDGDGVGDLCDPHPMVAGDHIDLFEGFHHGMPNWARSPNWVAAGDDVRVTAAPSTDEYLIIPLAATQKELVMASYVVEELPGSNTDHDVGVNTPYRASDDSGIECELYDPGMAGMPRYISLWNDFGSKEIGRNAQTWTLGTAYTLAIQRSGTSFGCRITDSTGQAFTATGTATVSPTQPMISVRAFAATARISWVMVIRSP
jgi:hypothetical protein